MADATTDTATKAGIGDLAEIFYAPGAVFARRTDGKFGMPYLALVALGVVLFFATKNLIQPVIDSEITRGFARAAAANPALTPEVQAQQMGIARTIGAWGIVAVYVLGPFIVGLFAWIAGKIAQVREIGTVAMMVATFSFFPRLVGGIVGAVFAAMIPEGTTPTAAAISLSPARFVDPEAHAGLAALLGRFDLFVLWGIFLIAVGVRVAGKATSKQAWGTAFGVWCVPTLFAVYSFVKNG